MADGREASRVRASIGGRRPGGHGRVEGGALLANSTPDALWNASALRLLRPSAVACREIRLRRGRETLLDRVTLSTPAGARLLLVSRPEEPASALLRILAGLTRPAGGEVELAGLEDPSPLGWGRRVAYVGPQPGVYPWMTPREALTFAGQLHGLDASEIDSRIGRLAGAYGLWRAPDRPITRGGPPFEQRVSFSAAPRGGPSCSPAATRPARPVSARTSRSSSAAAWSWWCPSRSWRRSGCRSRCVGSRRWRPRPGRLSPVGQPPPVSQSRRSGDAAMSLTMPVAWLAVRELWYSFRL